MTTLRKLAKTIRGMLGVGLTWGVAWAALGALLGWTVLLLRPQDIDAGESPGRIAAILGIAGLISGAGFALALSLLERGRTLRDVSLARVALWGATGGAIVPLLSSVPESQMLWTCPLGAGLAAGSVAIARRAERKALATAASAELPEADVGRLTPN